MSSGLQRRRVVNSSSSASQFDNTSGSNETGINTSLGSKNGLTEDGRKVAYDPEDIYSTAKETKQPKLTLMEEVVLLGLNDKLVCFYYYFFLFFSCNYLFSNSIEQLSNLLHRSNQNFV